MKILGQELSRLNLVLKKFLDLSLVIGLIFAMPIEKADSHLPPPPPKPSPPPPAAPDPKIALRKRLDEDPKVYKDIATELHWALVRAFPETEIELINIEVVSGSLVLDEAKRSEIPTSYNELTRIFENETSVDRSRTMDETVTIRQSTSISFAKSVTDSKSTEIGLKIEAKGFLGLVDITGSITKSQEITTKVDNGTVGLNEVTTVTKISETLVIPKMTWLFVRVVSVRRKTICPFEGSVTYSGKVRIIRSYNDLISGEHALEYALPNREDRTLGVTGQLISDISEEVRIQYQEKPVIPGEAHVILSGGGRFYDRQTF